MNPLLQGALFSLTPVGELRAGIPVAIAAGANPLAAIAACIVANALVTPLVFIFLNTLHRWFQGIPVYRRFSAHYLERARRKAQPSLERWGMAGLMVFVAIPLPLTGAYTGAAAAWALGMKHSHAFPAITAGVAIAGIIVGIVATGVITGMGWLL
jgi:uncharacterized membrane protein